MKQKRRPVNASLRTRRSGATRQARRKPYRVQPHVAVLLPGIDGVRLNALSDDLEDAERIRSLRPLD
jgi:hypothetical protein